MKKPVIGLTPLYDEAKDSYWMLPGYMKGIQEAGGIPVMLPLTGDEDIIRQLIRQCDGFLFTGGHDVFPGLYGEEKSPGCAACCPERDEMEVSLMKAALEQNKAVFGICRGMQFLNVYLGGSLYQDIPTEHPSELTHSQKPPYHEPVHEVEIMEASPLYSLLGKNRTQVNSCHHQAVKKLAPGLSVMARATDGLVEAVCMPEKKFVWAVQWHPEFFKPEHEDSRKLFGAFVKAAAIAYESI